MSGVVNMLFMVNGVDQNEEWLICDIIETDAKNEIEGSCN